MNALMQHSTSTIQNGWMTFFRQLAGQYKLKFVWGGSPKTDGQCIWLPHLPAKLTKDDLAQVKGHGFHEVGHCLFSDFSAFSSLHSSHGQFGFNTLKAIEDSWMEGKVSKGSKAAEMALREKNKVLLKRGMARLGLECQEDALLCFILCTLHLNINGWKEFSEPRQIAYNNFVKHFGEGAEGILDLIERILVAEARGCMSTQDNVKLTIRVLEALKQHAEEQDKEKNQNPDENQESDTSQEEADASDGEDSDDDSLEDSDGEGDDSSKSDEGESSDDCDPGDDSSDESIESGEGESADDSSDESSGSDGDEKPSMSDRVKQMLDSKPNDGEVFDAGEAIQELSEEIESGQSKDYDCSEMNTTPKRGEFDPEEVSGAGYQDFKEGMSVVPEDQQGSRDLIESIGYKGQVLSGQLRELLLTQEEAHCEIGRRGRLSGSKLYRIPLGNMNVYNSVDEQETGMAAVSVLADMSGSTGGECSRVIAQSILLFMDVMDAIHADLDIIGFGSETETATSLIKGFNEPSTAGRKRVGAMPECLGASTPLMEGLVEASIRLMSMDNNRKVMFVLTDGDPNDMIGSAAMTNLLIGDGVEIIYLLIGGNVRSDWLAQGRIPYLKVPNFDDLVPAMMSELRSKLI